MQRTETAIAEEPLALADVAAPQDLPSVDALMRAPRSRSLRAQHGHTLVANEARTLLASRRREAVEGSLPAGATQLDDLAAALAGRVEQRLSPRMRPVFNLTGTVIHTNLGRAVLADAALQRLLAVMAAPNNLEFDLSTGRRGDRDSIVEELLCTLTGAEAATVVNNNAGAVLLTIAALARQRAVIVSRGELVEIGGAFRMPDVMACAGARMTEVGTTNRTHPQDYERAIDDHTALVLKVHTSNYAVKGFTCAVDEATLAGIARARGLPLATDLGSGSLVDLARHGLPREPLPQEMLAAGCDVVTFSGDKLLGGPQAGLLVGSRAAIGRIRKDPLKRALRMGKLPLAALEATLSLYLRPEHLARDLPTLRWLTRPVAAIREVASTLLPAIAAALAPRYTVEIVDLESQIGSGSLPVDLLPSAGLALACPGTPRRGIDAALDALAGRLRALATPVIGRIAADRLLLDLRCLDDVPGFMDQLPSLREALR